MDGREKARTATPGVYRRGHRYVAVYRVGGRQRSRTFATYNEASLFKARTARRAPMLAPPPTPDGGLVYFVQMGGTGPIKVGWTAENIAGRIESLQCGNPEPLRLLGAHAGTRIHEELLHKRLASGRIRGEWFQPTPELIELALREEPQWGKVLLGWATSLATQAPDIARSAFSPNTVGSEA